jgi:cellulose synthase/poly-beta-1,6-N-acetylglucosamine synthase-like glycosyltransferase
MYYFEREDIKRKYRLKKFPLVSIIVPAYNEERTISATIKSILNLNYPKNKLEIIVVNDGSTDNSLKMVNKFRKVGVMIINKENGGKASALNVGLKYAKGGFVGCVDADSRVSRNSLKYIMGNFRDKETAAVVSSIKVDKPKKFIEKLQWFEYLFSLLIKRLMSSLNTLYVTPGVLSIYRKDILLENGGFEEGNITEDLEIAIRLHYLGYKIKTELNSITYTTVPKTVISFTKQRLRWYRGILINTRKYKKMLFNKKYDYMGVFQLPLNIITPIVVIIATLIISHGIFTLLYDFFLKFSVVDKNLLNFIPAMSYKEYLLGINYIVLLPTVIVGIFGLYMLHQAHKYVGESWRFPVTMILFLSIYPMLLAGYWVTVILFEMFGVKQKW